MGHQKAGFFNLSDTIYPKNQSFQVKNHMSFFISAKKNLKKQIWKKHDFLKLKGGGEIYRKIYTLGLK